MCFRENAKNHLDEADSFDYSHHVAAYNRYGCGFLLDCVFDQRTQSTTSYTYAIPRQLFFQSPQIESLNNKQCQQDDTEEWILHIEDKLVRTRQSLGYNAPRIRLVSIGYRWTGS